MAQKHPLWCLSSSAVTSLTSDMVRGGFISVCVSSIHLEDGLVYFLLLVPFPASVVHRMVVGPCWIVVCVSRDRPPESKHKMKSRCNPHGLSRPQQSCTHHCRTDVWVTNGTFPESETPDNVLYASGPQPPGRSPLLLYVSSPFGRERFYSRSTTWVFYGGLIMNSAAS